MMYAQEWKQIVESYEQLQRMGFPRATEMLEIVKLLMKQPDFKQICPMKSHELLRLYTDYEATEAIWVSFEGDRYRLHGTVGGNLFEEFHADVNETVNGITKLLRMF